VIVEVTDLTVRRAGRTVIDGLSLGADPGELVGIVGPNGCGKSTLLLAIAGVLAPSAGRVVIDRASVWGVSHARAQARRALGFVPEAADPPSFLSARELWALCATSRGVGLPDDELIAQLALDEIRDLALERMSLGQRRRACLAAALLGPPKLLVLDEPDNGLDARSYDALGKLLRAHAAGGGAALVATHDTALLERIGARTIALEVRA
jgi:ABC-type multidrug transport system ATPase subunit